MYRAFSRWLAGCASYIRSLGRLPQAKLKSRRWRLTERGISLGSPRLTSPAGKGSVALATKPGSSAVAIGRVELPDHLRDQGGPASLMTGSDTRAVVAIEVFVEEDVVAPLRIVLEEFVFAVEGSPTIRAALEQRDQPSLKFE